MKTEAQIDKHTYTFQALLWGAVSNAEHDHMRHMLAAMWCCGVKINPGAANAVLYVGCGIR